MSGSTFPRLHVWSDDEDVYASDLNAEFDNVLNNLNPSGVDGYEDSIAQMKLQTSPGGVGTEVLATSLAGEVERLRFVIARMIGGSAGLWYDAPAISVSGLNNILAAGNTIPSTRIASGRTRSATDTQPIFLQAAGGTTFTVKLLAAATNFSTFIDSTPYVGTTDLSATGLFAAPSTGNTATVNDATLTGQTSSLYAGESDAPNPVITISSAGAGITALVGQYAAFKHGAEYFLGYVESATTINRCFRGFFFDPSDAPIVRTVVSNGDTITLEKLVWVFYTSANALAVMYTNPVISFTQPAAPANGDYWFDLSAQTWKRYNGAIFVTGNAILIGVAVSNTLGCQASRSFDFYTTLNEKNTINAGVLSNTQITAKGSPSRISINGVMLDFGLNVPTWDLTLSLDSGVTIGNNTTYYLYISQFGKLLISNERPYNRFDLLGHYHPYHMWRCIGSVLTDGSANFASTSSIVQLDGSMLATGSVDRTRLSSLGQQISSSSGVFSTSSTSYVDVTNLSVTITTTGRPVMLRLQSDGTASGTTNVGVVGAGGAAITTLALIRGSTTLLENVITVLDPGSSSGVQHSLPPTVLSHLDIVSAGTYTYKIQQKVFSASYTGQVDRAVLVAYEL